MKTGQVIGATDRIAGEAVSRPVTYGELYATIYKNLGIDVENAWINDLEGRPQTLVEGHARPIAELICIGRGRGRLGMADRPGRGYPRLVDSTRFERGVFFRGRGRGPDMTAQDKAESLGITFSKQEPGYLAMVVRTGNLLITSGHVSDIKGKLGRGPERRRGEGGGPRVRRQGLELGLERPRDAERPEGLKLLGCVNSSLDFTDQHLVVNGCSDLLHEIFGKPGDGWHARSCAWGSPSPRPGRPSRSRRSSKSRRDAARPTRSIRPDRAQLCFNDRAVKL